MFGIKRQTDRYQELTRRLNYHSAGMQATRLIPVYEHQLGSIQDRTASTRQAQDTARQIAHRTNGMRAHGIKAGNSSSNFKSIFKPMKRRKKCACGCGRKAATGRTISETCKNRQWREKNPIGHAYKNLRTSAKKRGIVFTITLQQFTALAKRTGYVEGKGRSGDSLTIDRKNNLRGYEPGNVKVITRSQNSAKRHRDELRSQLQESGVYHNDELGNPF